MIQRKKTPLFKYDSGIFFFFAVYFWIATL